MTTSVVDRLGSEVRRTGQAVLLCAIAMWPPMIAGRIWLGAPATTMLLFGALVGFLNTSIAGRRVGAAAALVFVLVAPVSVLAGENSLAGASLLALGALLVGGASYWTRLTKLGPSVLVGMVFLVGAPAAVASRMIGGATETRYLLGVLIATTVCAFWPVVVLPRLVSITPIPADDHNPLVNVIPYTGVFAVLIMATSYWALAFGHRIHGIWLPLTIVMVLQVTPEATRHRLIHRVGGTTLGAITAVTIVMLVPPGWGIHLTIAVTFVGLYATMGREPYAVFVFFLTTLVLIGVSASESAVVGGEQRLLYTLIGAALATVAALLMAAISRWSGDQQAPA